MAYTILKEKFEYVFEALETNKNSRKEKLAKEFDSFLEECNNISLFSDW